MTATAQIGTTDWHLTGINSLGGVCDHCDRVLTHVYTVRNAVTGKTMTVGRACCKKVTGWTLAAAEAARILAAAQRREQRAAVWALFSQEHPDLAAIMDDAVAREVPSAYVVKSDLCEIPSAADREAFARHYVARLTA